MKYATGRYAKASCDRCGGIFKYGTLRPEYKSQKRTGLLTCVDCWDGEHPQDTPSKQRADAETLAHPRPRNEIAAVGDSPVANNAFVPPGGQSYEDWARENV